MLGLIGETYSRYVLSTALLILQSLVTRKILWWIAHGHWLNQRDRVDLCRVLW
jgi:hypothetical protein